MFRCTAAYLMQTPAQYTRVPLASTYVVAANMVLYEQHGYHVNADHAAAGEQQAPHLSEAGTDPINTASQEATVPIPDGLQQSGVELSEYFQTEFGAKFNFHDHVTLVRWAGSMLCLPLVTKHV